jgi:ABC-type transport system involved in multi-copper enzyme maturation permease subunit
VNRSIRNIYYIAKVSAFEFIRDKILYAALVIAGLLVALSFLLASMSLYEQDKLVADFGYTALTISLLFISVIAGSYLIPNEIERSTIHQVLVRPVQRGQFLVGKFLSIVFVNFVYTLLFGVVLFLLLAEVGMKHFEVHAMILMQIFSESVLVLAAAILFSIYVRPLIALVMGIVIYLAGHWLGDLEYFAQKSQDEYLKTLAAVFRQVIPNLYRYNWKSFIVLTESASFNMSLSSMLLYYSSWVCIFLIIASMGFRKRDLI